MMKSQIELLGKCMYETGTFEAVCGILKNFDSSQVGSVKQDLIVCPLVPKCIIVDQNELDWFGFFTARTYLLEKYASL